MSSVIYAGNTFEGCPSERFPFREGADATLRLFHASRDLYEENEQRHPLSIVASSQRHPLYSGT